MTPLIAGIALQGSPPMYEGMVKAKEQAAAKRKSAAGDADKRLKDLAYEGIDFDYESYHPHYKDAASETFLAGMDNILSNIDPNDPHAENKLMREVMGLQKKLSAYKGASDVLFSIEDSKFRDNHYVSDSAIEWLNESRFGDEVPPEIQDELSFYAINYGQRPGSDGELPYVAVDAGVSEKKDYIKPFMVTLEKMQGDWQAMDEQAKRQYLGNARIETVPYNAPYSLAEPILNNMANNKNAVINIKKETGLDITTDEGKRAFYESYAPSKPRTARGSVSSSRGYGDRDPNAFNQTPDVSNITIKSRNGLYTTPYENQYQTRQVTVGLVRNGGFMAGERTSYSRLDEGDQQYKVLSYGQMPIYKGDKSFNIRSYKTKDGRVAGPFTINPGDPVPNDLREYIEDGRVDGVTDDDIVSEWMLKVEGSTDTGEKKSGTESTFVPFDSKNAKRYLITLRSQDERRAEAMRLKDLGIIDGNDMNEAMRAESPTEKPSSSSPSGSKPKDGSSKKPDDASSFFRQE